MKKEKMQNMAKIGIIAALYAVVTLLTSPMSFGAVQVRFSEILDNLAVFNKRYIWALTLGCVISNLNSPLGIVDIVWGSLETLIAASITYWLASKVKSMKWKMCIPPIVNAVMMFMVAIELHVFNKLPFGPTYLTTAAGEFVAVAIGAVIFYIIGKRIDLTK